MESVLPSINPLWVWVGLACLFLAVEALLAPSGFFLCLGTAAAVMAGATLLVPGISWLWALTIFSALSVIACWIWWRVIRKKSRSGEDEKESSLNEKSRQLIGYRGILEKDLRAGKGRLKVNDSPWLVEAEVDYPAGTVVEVTGVKGITLLVKAVAKDEA